MKHITYFEGRSMEVDTERNFKFALIGKRDPASDRPPGLEVDEKGVHTINGRPNTEWTDAEKDAVRKFNILKTDKGRYNTRVLDWFESEESAQAALDRWNDWLDLRIVPVATTIPSP
jgi:hypothetical protein